MWCEDKENPLLCGIVGVIMTLMKHQIETRHSPGKTTNHRRSYNCWELERATVTEVQRREPLCKVQLEQLKAVNHHHVWKLGLCVTERDSLISSSPVSLRVKITWPSLVPLFFSPFTVQRGSRQGWASITGSIRWSCDGTEVSWHLVPLLGLGSIARRTFCLIQL